VQRIPRPDAAEVVHRFVYGPGTQRMLFGLAVGAVGLVLFLVLGFRTDLTGAEVRPGMALTILAATLVGGLWPGLVTTAAGWVLYLTLFGQPMGEFRVGPAEILVLAAFLAASLVVAYLAAASASAKLGRQRLSFLADINDLLTSSFDYDRTLGEVARQAVPELADWCAIHVFDVDGTTLRLEVAHSDPDKVREVRELSERYPPALNDRSQPLSRVLQSGEPILIGQVSDELLRSQARSEDHLDRIRSLGVRSALIVPLRARGRTFGALTVAMAESGRRYRKPDLQFMQQLARSAATALDNARLFSESSAVARTLQQSLLPADLPEIPGVEVAARYRAAAEGTLVGGDFYDLFETGRGDWVMVVGDVCGKGAEAAALTGLVRHTIRAVSVREANPSRVLELVNRQILRGTADRFCTAMVANVRPNGDQLQLRVSCAGHPPPLVLRPGRTVEATDCEGTLLGIFADPELVDRTVDLRPGDSVVLYTDGVVERFERAGRGGDAHLVSLLWESEGDDAAGIADRIYRDAAMDGGERSKDDLAVVVLRVRPGQAVSA
jgi:serine phosphatase RsbU (regulator of sigma subunit)